MSNNGLLIGGGFLLLTVIVVLIIVLGDFGSNEQGTGAGEITGEVPDENPPNVDAIEEQEPNEPLCSEFDCGANEDNKPGRGDTHSKCCEKKLCNEQSPQPSCDAPEELDGQARGDTTDECCSIPYCDTSLCDTGWTLKGQTIRGVTKADCCREVPTCESFSCPVGEEKKQNPGMIYGETPVECCDVKSCTENQWDTKCGNTPSSQGMTWSDSSADTPGKTVEECCTPGSCYDNDFTGTKGEVKCQSQFFGGNDALFPIMGDDADGGLLGVIYGRTVKECCSMKKCKDITDATGNSAWTDETCGDGKGPKNPGDEYGNSEDVCCEDKVCKDWVGDCPANKKKVPDDTVGETADVCCTEKTCSEHYPGFTACSDDLKKWSPDSLVGTAHAGSAEDNSVCCTEKKCNDPSDGFNRNKCNDSSKLPSTDGDTPDVAEINGVSLYDYDSSKSEEPLAWGTCCKSNVKCKDVYTDATCPTGQKADTDARELVIDSGDPLTGISQVEAADKCCATALCSDMTVTCPAEWEPDTEKRGNNYADPSESPSACCSLKTCADNNWTDAKCKDKNYTTAFNRGKLKIGARGYGPDHVQSTSGVPYDAPNGSEGAEVSQRSDEHCCEQDLENNFARTCIHNELDKNGNVHRKSAGATLWPFKGLMGTKLSDSTVATAEACLNSCKSNESCNSFWFQDNGRCVRLPGFNSASSKVRSKDNTTGDLDWEYLAPVEGGGSKYSHYFNAASLPEDKRYSGGNHDDQKDFGKLEGCVGQIDGNNGGNCHDSSGGSPTLPAGQGEDGDANDWEKREEILLAGVDEEFCPFHWVHAYTHHHNIYPHTHGSNAPEVPLRSDSDAEFNRITPPTGFGGTLEQIELAPARATSDPEDKYPWIKGGDKWCFHKKLGDHYDGCWDDKNCRKFMTHVGGTAPDAATQHLWLQTPSQVQTFMTRPERRRACVDYHVGDDTETRTDGRSGHTLIKSIHIDRSKSVDKRFIHGKLPPKATVANNDGDAVWNPVQNKMLITGDTAV